jgi:hypothetical protein
VNAENCEKHLYAKDHQDYREQQPKPVVRDDQENARAHDCAKH